MSEKEKKKKEKKKAFYSGICFLTFALIECD